MILKNSFLEIEINENNGGIIYLNDISRDVKFLDRPKYAHLFRVLIPNEEKWIAQYADSDDCKVDRIEKINDTSAKIYYENIITPEGVELDVKVVVEAWLEEDELKLTMALTNNTDLLIHSVRFPWIGGWDVDVDSETDIARIGTEAPRILSKFKKGPGYTLLKKDMRSCDWLHIPTIDITGKIGGIGLNQYITKPQTMHGFICCETQGWDEETISFGFIHYPFLSNNETYKTEICGISLNDGDHTKTWDRMKNYVATWWKAPNTPKYLEETIGYANYQLRDFEGRNAHKVSDLPKLCEEARAMGMHDVTFWDMMFNIYLRAGNGWYMDDGEEGRVEEIKKYVEAEKANGMHLSTLVNYRLVSKRPTLYEEKAKYLSMQGVYGLHMYESFPCRSESAKWYTVEYEEYAHPMCQNHPDFQKNAVNLAKEVIERTGTDALFIDQPFGNNYCLCKDHGHRPGIDDHEGAMKWISTLRNDLNNREGFSYIIGEVPELFNTQYIDLWWHWPWNEQGPEVMRYILPRSLQSWTIDAHEHENEVNKGFSLGMLLCVNSRGLDGNISECPEFIKRVKRLSDLKHKTYSRVPVTAYIGKKNLRCESELTVEVNAYEVDGKRGLILGDCTKRSKGGEVTLFIEDKTLDINEIKVFSEYGNEYNAQFTKNDSGYEVKLELKPLEAVVLYLD